jgi:hypothetical protein
MASGKDKHLPGRKSLLAPLPINHYIGHSEKTAFNLK